MLAEGFARYLTEQGLVDYRPTLEGGDTFLGTVPPTPDALVVLTDTAGGDLWLAVGLERPSFQLLVRGAEHDYPGPQARCNDLIAVLHGLDTVTLPPSGLALVACDAEQTYPAPLGQDRNNRWRFIANFGCRTWQPVT